MVENKERLFLCNRWFYLVDETEDTFFYSTNINPKKSAKSSVQLELNKQTKEMRLVYLQKQKMIGIINISDITSYPVQFHYSQSISEEMVINGNTYVNLLIELFASLDGAYSASKQNYEILFHRNKKMKKMCYCEPDFSLDKKINARDICFSCNRMNDFEDLVSNFSGMLSSIGQHIFNDNSKKNIVNQSETIDASNQEIRNLEIPQEIMVYDRVYQLKKTNESCLFYQNDDDGIYKLVIKLDYSNLKVDSIKIQIDKGQDKKSAIQICSNEQSGISVSLNQNSIATLLLNNEVLNKATIKSLIVYDSFGAEISNEVDISSLQGQYHLVKHPHLKYFFIDEEGVLYKITNSEYHLCSSIGSYSHSIFHSIEKKLIKKENI